MCKEIWLPMFGYKSEDEFKARMTLNGRMHKIKMPMMALSAYDDLILNPDTIPR